MSSINWKYQVVIEFLCTNEDDFDRILAVEDAAITKCGDTCKIDGHDIGNGIMNLFILSNSYSDAKALILNLPELRGLDTHMRMGYRLVDNSEYHPLYPPDLTVFKLR